LLAEKNRSRFRWGLPQGGVEEGESHIDGAKREIEEELGLRLNKLYPTDINYPYEWPEEHQQKRGFWGQEVKFFLAKLPPDQEIKYNLDDPYEPQNSQLVSLEEAQTMIEGEEYFAIIKQLHAQANQA